MKKLCVILFVVLLQWSCADKTSESKLSEQANTFLAGATTNLESEEFSKSLEQAKNALEIFEKQKDSLGMIKSLYTLSRASALSGNFEDAVLHGKKARGLCKVFINYPLEYKINNTLSWAYFTLSTDFDENIEHQRRQLFVVNQMDDDAAKAGVYNNYGYDITVAGTIPLNEALGYSKFANDYYAKAENNNGRWYTLMNLTWQHRLMADFEKSEQYGKLSVNQADQDKDRHAIIEAYTNLGETYLAQDRIKEATPLYLDALETSLEQEDRDKYVFDVYYSKFLWVTGEEEKAISLLKKAVDFLETSEVFYEMLGRAYLAEFYYQLKEYDLAEEQIDIIENPRSNYISFETRCLAAMVKAKVISGKNQNSDPTLILKSNLKQAERIGAKLLSKSIRETLLGL